MQVRMVKVMLDSTQISILVVIVLILVLSMAHIRVTKTKLDVQWWLVVALILSEVVF